MKEWLKKCISDVIGADVADGLTEYVLSVENVSDFDEYMKDLFDFSIPTQRRLYDEIKLKKFGSLDQRKHISVKQDTQNENSDCNNLGLKNKRKTNFIKQTDYSKQKGNPDNNLGSKDKSNFAQVHYPKIGESSYSSILNKNLDKPVQNSEQKEYLSSVEAPAIPSTLIFEGVNQELSAAQSTTYFEKKKTKKYRKFLLSEFQKGYLKEGRNRCDCRATVHNLINNCLSCGRVVCEQEGSGPCFFCDAMVCRPEELDLLNSDSKEGDMLYQSLAKRKKVENWKKAIETRDRLLHYDETKSTQTRVIDDENDYFNVHSPWLTDKEREKIQKKIDKENERKNASRLSARVVTLNLLDKLVEEVSPAAESEEEEDVDEVEINEEEAVNSTGPDIETLINSISQYKEELEKSGEENSLTESKKEILNQEALVQVGGVSMFVDNGVCLSMHQPWASLLVAGIKKHEGRTWYTPHRGSLWIASTQKVPDPQTITEVENFYRTHYNDPKIKFPEEYPTGRLLGNVMVDDCLQQTEYREEYPDGESDSPYVWICSSPAVLTKFIKIKGRQKLYKLDPDIHALARKLILTN